MSTVDLDRTDRRANSRLFDRTALARPTPSAVVATIGHPGHMITESAELLPGERIVWSGRPLRHRLLRVPEDVWVIPVSLFWGSILVCSLFDEMGAGNGPPVFSVVWGILGFCFIVGRFVVRQTASNNTRYVITSSRVVIVGGVTGARLQTFYLTVLGPPAIREYSNGSGDLAFLSSRVRMSAFPSALDRIRGPRRPSLSAHVPGPPRLRDIPQVRHVRDLVQMAQTEVRRGNPTA
jgi:hypothetical protein